jgi:nucleoside-diphosphate-sugar epimerase
LNSRSVIPDTKDIENTPNAKSDLVVEDIDIVLRSTDALWRELRGSTVLLTGGTGFFGTWLLETLIRANSKFGLNASVRLLTRNPAKFTKDKPHIAHHAAVTIATGDIRAFEVTDAFDFVIHAAADSVAADPPVSDAEQQSVIVDGTRHVLEVARRCRAQRVLYVSSGAVYGQQPYDIEHIREECAETADPSTRTPYGVAKWAAEKVCRLATDQGPSVTIARCFAFVGPYLPLNAHFAIGNFIRDGLVGGPIIVNGDGTPYRSYLYMSDLSLWLWTILLKGASGRAYNVGSEEALTIAETARAVAASFASVPEVRVLAPASDRKSRYVPSTERARRELGLVESVKLSDAIERTKRWYR